MPGLRLELFKLLSGRFSEEDLRTLCYALYVDYTDLSGGNRSAKARELVLYLEQHNRLAEMVETASQLRPDIDWREVRMMLVDQVEDAPKTKTRFLYLMVTGGRSLTPELEELAGLLGREVIGRGHVLLSNGAAGVDKAVAAGALAACQENGHNPNLKIQIFRPRKAPKPSFGFGNLQIAGSDYSERRNYAIQWSQAVIIVDGSRGTELVARHARILERPVIPIGLGQPEMAAVKRWHEMHEGLADDLPLISISRAQLRRIGPGQRKMAQVASAAVVIAESLCRR